MKFLIVALFISFSIHAQEKIVERDVPTGKGKTYEISACTSAAIVNSFGNRVAKSSLTTFSCIQKKKYKEKVVGAWYIWNKERTEIPNTASYRWVKESKTEDFTRTLSTSDERGTVEGSEDIANEALTLLVVQRECERYREALVKSQVGLKETECD